ncbi:hypothetical protein BO82DRAFT_46075 [Aspergillus uvarum CBS 121591]|uniref:Uncharacterized protein n=1 Tax=Aspergillus uvarum CBS 121591 TaxID=1448315 RepID=A0A319CH14_9EURO|nr:hypothetical protein BO82DRAFT_46075 [Aspergillus uvarum CBS 121591]PYH83111.1 hypothetical protein BO82DRAFT_46075 [Aspergillus uvarum CBS 121591]
MASHPSIKAGPLQSTPMPLIPDDSNHVSHHIFSAPPERLVTRSTPSSTVHSRETSTVRGLDSASLSSSSLQPQNNRRGASHSKSPEPIAGRPGFGYDGGLERRPSNSYGHHRQTSIVHGIQHSRNPSFAASTASSSPLSSELIVSLGRSGAVEPEGTGSGRPEQPSMHSTFQYQGSNGVSAHIQGTLGTIDDRDGDDVVSGSLAVVTHKRMNSNGNGKPKPERSHSRSHSRPHPDIKSTEEYALHHLFNAVSQSTFP